jgi:hypothetical protein
VETQSLLFTTTIQRSAMAVGRINREMEIARVNLVRDSPIIRVCKATREEWRTYVESDNQALKSTCCEWIDGSIYIVEIPSLEHDLFSSYFDMHLSSQRAIAYYLRFNRSSFIPGHPDLPDYEPDNSYGPNYRLRARLPRGIDSYASWFTLVLEVGYARRWRDQPGQLDWKAREWAGFPAVRFILCVAVEERLEDASYKLYTVQRNRQGQARPLPDVIPDRVEPHTVVSLDSRELLGLDPWTEHIPPHPVSGERFPDPTVDVDLFAILEEARLQGFGEN